MRPNRGLFFREPQSLSTIIRISSTNVTVGFQRYLVRAFVASPRK